MGVQDQPCHPLRESFAYAHWVHKQPRITKVWLSSLQSEVKKDAHFGILSFVYQNRVNSLVMAYRNKWPEDWYMHRFYYRIETKGEEVHPLY